MDTRERKVTTSRQFAVMMKFLEDNAQMVTGAFVCINSKKTTSDLWEELAKSLNAEGPPARDVLGWKKVIFTNMRRA